MSSALKEAVIDVIRKLPDSAGSEEIMGEVNFISHVMEGLADSEAGRTITTEELLERVAVWRAGDVSSGFYRSVQGVASRRLHG